MFIKVVSWNTGVQQLAAYVVHPCSLVLQVLWLSPAAISTVLALTFCLTLTELSVSHGGIYIQSGDPSPRCIGRVPSLMTVDSLVIYVRCWNLCQQLEH